jgi:hypothetical protein
LFDQTLEDRRGNVVRKVCHHSRGRGGLKHSAKVRYQSIGFYEAKIILAGEFRPQPSYQITIKLNRDQVSRLLD